MNYFSSVYRESFFHWAENHLRGIANLFFGLQCIASLAVEGNWFECFTLFPTKNTTLSPDLVTRGLALLDLQVSQIWWRKCIEWNLVFFHGKISFLGVLRLSLIQPQSAQNYSATGKTVNTWNMSGMLFLSNHASEIHSPNHKVLHVRHVTVLCTARTVSALDFPGNRFTLSLFLSLNLWDYSQRNTTVHVFVVLPPITGAPVQFSTPETIRGMGTNFQCNDFWDRVGGHVLLMIGGWYQLRRKLIPNLPMASGVRNCYFHIGAVAYSCIIYSEIKQVNSTNQHTWTISWTLKTYHNWFNSWPIFRNQFYNISTSCEANFCPGGGGTPLYKRDCSAGSEEQLLKCGGRRPPFFEVAGGEGQIWLFSLCRCLELSDCWSAEPFLSTVMFKNFKSLKSTFLLLSLIAHADDPPVEVCKSWYYTVGSCNSFILSSMSSTEMLAASSALANIIRFKNL